jgi:hypothetical protein
MEKGKFIKWLKDNLTLEIEIVRLKPLPGNESVKGIVKEETLKEQKKVRKNLFKYLESTIKRKWN